jgi:uncharacterized membrane protein YidH (DUF202 family)
VNSPSGLQAERTRLAWRRTSLAMTVVTVLAVRLALTRGLAGALLAAAALAGWVAVLWLTFPRIAGTHRRHPEGGGSALPLLALAAVGYAVLGMLLVLAALG